MSRHARFRLLKNEDGQNSIEAAVVVALLAFIVLALMDFAYIFQDYIGITNAANVGATYGATSLTAAQNSTTISNIALAENTNWHCTSTSVSSSVSTDGYGYNQVSVTVRCQVAGLRGLRGTLGALQLSSTAVRRVRQ